MDAIRVKSVHRQWPTYTPDLFSNRLVFNSVAPCEEECEKKRCRGCGAFLRRGNKGEYCSPCRENPEARAKIQASSMHRARFTLLLL